MRITMQMMMDTYKRNVGDAFATMNKTMQHAYDYRAFDRPSDDPLAAAQTFDCHWEMSLNSDYSANVQNLEGVAKTADSILQNVDGIVGSNASGSTSIKTILQGINGTMNPDNRGKTGDELLKVRDSILQEMNAKYGDGYIFGGANSGSAPFQMIGNQLYYRGINVDTGENLNGASSTVNYRDPSGNNRTIQINFGSAIGNKLDTYKIQLESDPVTNYSASVSGNIITIKMPDSTEPTPATKGGLQSYLTSTQFATDLHSGGITTIPSTAGITISGLPDNQADKVISPSTPNPSSISDVVDLSALANEKVYVDIGLGITSTNGKVDDQSAYNSSMPGISFLGYGTRSITNDDGTFSNIPCNICSLLTTIANDMKSSGSESNTDLLKQLSPYIDSLKDSQSSFEAQQTEMGEQMSFLSDTASYLSDTNINLSEKDNNVEYINPSDAIEDFYTQQYCYNAALKVGSQILGKSLMDYLT